MIYDYKSNDSVQDVILDSIEKLTEDIEDEYESLRRYDSLVIYSPAFLAREIVGEILDDEDDVWVNEDSNYGLFLDDDNEVLITLAYDGMIFIEDARCDGKLIVDDEAALTYIYDGFSKRDVERVSSEGESVLVFGFDEDALDEFDGYEINGIRTTKEVFDRYVDTYIKPKNDEESCDDCQCQCACDGDGDGDIHGFTASRSDKNGYMSYSFYTSESLSKKDIQGLLQEMGLLMD